MKLSDVNIEFAHVDFSMSFDAPALKRQIMMSGEIAQSRIEREAGSGLSCTTSVLIDDKNCDVPPTIEDVGRFLALFAGCCPAVDFICYESVLPSYEEKLVRSLRPNVQEKVRREIDVYKEKHGGLGCSHDIAIWHLLRLGNLGPVRPNSIFPVGAIFRPSRPFFSERAVSILPKEVRGFEERAKSELISQCADQTVLERIEVVYF